MPEQHAGPTPSRLAGDSWVQREAEPHMVTWLSDHLGARLAPRRFTFPDGSRVEVDAACDDPPVLCEAWAHQGPPKAAQKAKVMNDAMKLLAAARQLPAQPRLILLFADEAAASPFQRGTWRAAALAEAGIDVIVCPLDSAIRARIRQAQHDQYR